MDCGNLPHRVEHARNGLDRFFGLRAFGGYPLVLCNACEIEFATYYPEYFGLPRSTNLFRTVREWPFIREIPPELVKDKVCGQCHRRLAFLKFLAHTRAMHEGD